MPAAVALLALLPFLGILRNGFVSWDDPTVVLENPLLKLPWGEFLPAAATARPLAAWQPLGWVLYRIVYGAAGPSPAAFHAASLLLHAASAGLLCAWLLASLAPKTRWGRLSCAAAALLWAWHPVQAENVAWASTLSDLLCGALVFGALLLRERGRSRAGLALFALGGLCRWKALAYPILCLLRDRGRRKADWPALGGVTALVLLSSALAKSGGGYAAALKGEAAAGVLWQWSKLLWPARLAPVAVFAPSENPLGLSASTAWLLLAGLVAALVAARRRAPDFVLAAAAFTACFLPTLAASQPARLLLYDHHVSLALAAFTPVVAAAAARGRAARAVLAAALLAAGSLTAAQCAVWRTTETLWTKTLDVFPGSMTAVTHLVRFYAESNRHAEGLLVIDRALEARPGYEFLVGLRGALLSNVAPDSPRRAALERAAAAVLFRRGDVRGASERLETALSFAPKDPDILVDAAVAAEASGDRGSARRRLEEALRAAPRHPRAAAALSALDAAR